MSSNTKSDENKSSEPTDPTPADLEWYSQNSMYVDFWKPVVEHVDETEEDYTPDDVGY